MDQRINDDGCSYYFSVFIYEQNNFFGYVVKCNSTHTHTHSHTHSPNSFNSGQNITFRIPSYHRRLCLTSSNSQGEIQPVFAANSVFIQHMISVWSGCFLLLSQNKKGVLLSWGVWFEKESNPTLAGGVRVM